MKPAATAIGVIGAGAISGVYLRAEALFPELSFVAVADLDAQRAREQARRHALDARGVDEVLNSPDIDVVLNLTVPSAHAAVSLAALKAGKAVYSEKPLATRLLDGQALLDAAGERRLMLGCAPDTFLGAGLQACRHALDRGLIGHPVAASAFMTSHGPESWHPNPDFFYQPGAGPLFDMGPYYLTALVHLLGPIRRVAAFAATGSTERVVGSGPRAGERIPVTTPTHVAGLLEHHGGAVTTLLLSFEVWASELPRIEIYGTDGSLSAPDPNTFGGPARLRRPGQDGWEELPLASPYVSQTRGLGLAEMILARARGRPARAGAQLALHVLEAMEALLTSAAENHPVDLETRPERPEPLAAGPLAASFA